MTDEEMDDRMELKRAAEKLAQAIAEIGSDVLYRGLPRGLVASPKPDGGANLQSRIANSAIQDAADLVRDEGITSYDEFEAAWEKKLGVG